MIRGQLLYFKSAQKIQCYQKSSNIYWLSENGESLDIAQNLYQILRATDALNYEFIYIEAINETEGLMAALKDRLSKAASQ